MLSRSVFTRGSVNMLTHEQVAFYHEQGYLVVPDVLSPAELEELREATRSFEEEAATLEKSDHRFVIEPDRLDGRSLIYRVVDPILHHPTYERVMQLPQVLDLVSDLLGTANIRLHHTKMFTKYP